MLTIEKAAEDEYVVRFPYKIGGETHLFPTIELAFAYIKRYLDGYPKNGFEWIVKIEEDKK